MEIFFILSLFWDKGYGECECIVQQLKRHHVFLADQMSPLLFAAQNGITEIVNNILRRFPMAIHDTCGDKNIVLLAVQNRQPHVCKLLFDKYIPNDTLLLKVDDKKNSAMHLAAMLGENRPWLIPGAALQMQWEIKWYEV